MKKQTDKFKGAFESEVKKVVTRVKSAQKQFQSLLAQRERVITEVRKYADDRGKEVKKLVGDDLKKVKSFIARERKELEKLQKRLPDEISKIKGYVDSQRKELEGLWKRITEPKSASAQKPAKRKSTIQPVTAADQIDDVEADETDASQGTSQTSSTV